MSLSPQEEGSDTSTSRMEKVMAHFLLYCPRIKHMTDRLWKTIKDLGSNSHGAGHVLPVLATAEADDIIYLLLMNPPLLLSQMVFHQVGRDFFPHLEQSRG